MLKQYLIPQTFTRGDTPIEYEYKQMKCDMRTRISRQLSKYEWKESIQHLLGLAHNYGFVIKINSFGDIRLIAPNSKTAFSFYRIITFNHLLGVTKEV